MCGIAGILAATSAVEQAHARAREMAACLEHRGPDAEGSDARPGLGAGDA